MTLPTFNTGVTIELGPSDIAKIIQDLSNDEQTQLIKALYAQDLGFITTLKETA
jgi:hypothetical protein